MPEHLQATPSDLPLFERPEASAKVTRTTRLAKWLLRGIMQEYLEASAYFRSIGAQTPSANYGGSRSMIYYQMLERSTSLTDLQRARSNYHQLHNDTVKDNDEYGALLRIAGYRLRKVPAVSDWLEARVRADDASMALASFCYPDDCNRYAAPLTDLPVIIPDSLLEGTYDHSA